MAIIERIQLAMAKSKLQDIEAWIKIARGKGLTDKIARAQFSWQFKDNEQYARFLELLKRQQEENIVLMEKHFMEQKVFWR